MASPLPIIIVGFFIIFFAGVTRGLTGFGFALVAVPTMVIFLPPKVVVPISLIHGTLITIALLIETWKWVDLKRIWPLMVAGIVGIPFGTYLLIVLDVSLLKMFVGLFISLFAVAFLKGFKKEIKSERLAFAPIGVISGLLNGSTAMSGPPVILFFTNQDMSTQVFRANLTAYFMVLNLATMPALVIGGLMTHEVVNYALLFLPAMIAGAFIGIRLAHKVERELFQRIVLVIVLFAGMLLVASGLGIL